MCNPPGVDLAAEHRKLGGQLGVEVKHGCQGVRLPETPNKVLGDRELEFRPVTFVRFPGIKQRKIEGAITAAIVAGSIRRVAILFYVAGVFFFGA